MSELPSQPKRKQPDGGEEEQEVKKKCIGDGTGDPLVVLLSNGCPPLVIEPLRDVVTLLHQVIDWYHLDQVEDTCNCVAMPVHCCFKKLPNAEIDERVQKATAIFHSTVANSTADPSMSAPAVYYLWNLLLTSKIETLQNIVLFNFCSKLASAESLRLFHAAYPSAIGHLCQVVAMHQLTASPRQGPWNPELVKTLAAVAPYEYFRAMCSLYLTMIKGVGEIQNTSTEKPLFQHKCEFLAAWRQGEFALSTVFSTALVNLVPMLANPLWASRSKTDLVCIVARLALHGWHSPEHILLCQDLAHYACSSTGGKEEEEEEDCNNTWQLQQQLTTCQGDKAHQFARSIHAVTIKQLQLQLAPNNKKNGDEEAKTKDNTAMHEARLFQAIDHFCQCATNVEHHVGAATVAVVRAPTEFETPHVFGLQQQQVLNLPQIITSLSSVMQHVYTKGALSWQQFPRGLPPFADIFCGGAVGVRDPDRAPAPKPTAHHHPSDCRSMGRLSGAPHAHDQRALSRDRHVGRAHARRQSFSGPPRGVEQGIVGGHTPARPRPASARICTQRSGSQCPGDARTRGAVHLGGV